MQQWREKAESDGSGGLHLTERSGLRWCVCVCMDLCFVSVTVSVGNDVCHVCLTVYSHL